MSNASAPEIPDELVQATIAAAEQRGEDVADVPLTAIAAAAGISRSTLLRRIGGTRRGLDEAVRAAGVEPGGRLPVRERAIVAGARRLSEHGLAALTLESVADAAGCSAHSLYVVFGGRDHLLAAIFERYSPILAFESLTAGPSPDLAATIRRIYAAMVASFTREPRVAPALLADLLARPDGPASRVFQRFFPRLRDSVGALLLAEVRAGRLRPLPLPLLLQQLIGPVAMHLAARSAWPDAPDIDAAGEVFAANFLRAVGLPADARPPKKPK